MPECKYQEHCEAYRFLMERQEIPRCKDLLDICKLEASKDLADACYLYHDFEKPFEYKAVNKKPYLTKE